MEHLSQIRSPKAKERIEIVNSVFENMLNKLHTASSGRLADFVSYFQIRLPFCRPFRNRLKVIKMLSRKCFIDTAKV